jgi:hypothetical protein
MVAFGAQLNYDVSVSVFILLYCRRFAHSPFANTYFSFYHGRATKILLLMSKVIASSILERGYQGSSYPKSIVKKEKFITHRLTVR